MRIAFCHTGNSNYARNDARTPPLDLWRSLWVLGGEWISLRKLSGTPVWRAGDELDKTVEVRPDLVDLPPNVRDAGPDLLDAKTSVEIMQSCDLTITVDTMAANLAGSYGGIRAWVLLSAANDWRWALTQYSPWFPDLTLYRQPTLGDWESVFARLKEDLRAVSAAATV